ncbi:hypothetical protein D3C87_1787280 [compost metagenome]
MRTSVGTGRAWKTGVIAKVAATRKLIRMQERSQVLPSPETSNSGSESAAVMGR